jgi:DNA-binding MarR family transcriptional regulator
MEEDMTVKADDLPSLRSRLQGLAGDTDLIGLELLRRISRVANLYDTILNQRLRSSELSGPRWHLLVRLFAEEMRHGRGGMSPTYLSRCQDVSKNTISSLLRGLEERGLIERALDPVDRRGFRIQLSDSGRALVRASAPTHLEELNKLLTDLTPDERSGLIVLLDKLYRSLVEHGGLPEPAVAWRHHEETFAGEGEAHEK